MNTMAESLRSLFRRLCMLTLVHTTYTFLGALLFIYIEECNAVKTNGIRYNKFKAYLSRLKQLGSLEKVMILNKTAGFFESGKPPRCAIVKDTLVKWWDFTIITCATIGFGNVTPKTDAGKIAVMIYAFVGIPLTLALYRASAELLTAGSGKAIIKIEVNWLKRERVNRLEKKKVLMCCVLLFSYATVVSKLLSSNFGISFVDSAYLTFQSLTTIGYGDVVDNIQTGLLQEMFLLFSASFGLGLTACLIASVVAVVEDVDVRKVIRKISSSKRSWSLRTAPDISRSFETEMDQF